MWHLHIEVMSSEHLHKVSYFPVCVSCLQPILNKKMSPCWEENNHTPAIKAIIPSKVSLLAMCESYIQYPVCTVYTCMPPVSIITITTNGLFFWRWNATTRWQAWVQLRQIQTVPYCEKVAKIYLGFTNIFSSHYYIILSSHTGGRDFCQCGTINISA